MTAKRRKAPQPSQQGSSAVEPPPDKREVAGSSPAPVTTLAGNVGRFVVEYLKDNNGKQAAIRAGYSAKSAESQASRLLRNAKVRAEVKRLQDEQLERVQQDTGITLERTLRYIARGAFFDPRKLFNADGSPKAITDLDDDTAVALAGLEVLEEFSGTGKDKVFIGYTKKFKLADRKGYLDMLMRHLDGYRKDSSANGNAIAALLASFQRSALPVVPNPADDD